MAIADDLQRIRKRPFPERSVMFFCSASVPGYLFSSDEAAALACAGVEQSRDTALSLLRGPRVASENHPTVPDGRGSNSRHLRLVITWVVIRKKRFGRLLSEVVFMRHLRRKRPGGRRYGLGI